MKLEQNEKAMLFETIELPSIFCRTFKQYDRRLFKNIFVFGISIKI